MIEPDYKAFADEADTLPPEGTWAGALPTKETWAWTTAALPRWEWHQPKKDKLLGSTALHRLCPKGRGCPVGAGGGC